MRVCASCGSLAWDRDCSCRACGGNSLLDAGDEVNLRAVMLLAYSERSEAFANATSLRAVMGDIYPGILSDVILMSALDVALYRTLHGELGQASEGVIRQALSYGRRPFPEDVISEVVDALSATRVLANDPSALVSQYAEQNIACDDSEVGEMDLCELRAMASRGSSVALNEMGVRYEFGRGVARDEVKAARLFRLAADQGNADAQFNLGRMYKSGSDGIAQDDTEACRLYRLAANQGHARAQFSLGRMCEHGRGVPQDYAEAVRLYRLAADQGNAGAQLNLALMYENGQGVVRDEAEATKFYRLAASQGIAHAQFRLGRMYRSGSDSVAQDEAQACMLYRLAADQGHARAQCNLGWMYEHGRGVPQDYAEAVRLYRLAADQGLALAQFNLGVMYENGLGVDRNDFEAARLYSLAANQGLSDAQFNLGNMYEHGRGVVRDEVEAKRLYYMAAAQGDKDALRVLDAMHESDRENNWYVADTNNKLRHFSNELKDMPAQLFLELKHGIDAGIERGEAEAARICKAAADEVVEAAKQLLSQVFRN